MSNEFDIELFDSATQRIRKVKRHSIELFDGYFVFKANYLCDEKQDGIWKEELWRFWEEHYIKQYVSRYGVSRTLYEDSEEAFFSYTICVMGTDDDIILLFESKIKCLEFHNWFKSYMNG